MSVHFEGRAHRKRLHSIMNAMHYQLLLDAKVAHHIRRHAEACYPYECCGFLYGREDGHRLLTHALPAPNSKQGDRRRRFEIAPKDYLRAEQYAGAQGLQLLGIYHSHPDHPAVASRHDLRQAMPFFSYLIVAVWHGHAREMRSWRLREGVRAFDEERISIISDCAKS